MAKKTWLDHPWLAEPWLEPLLLVTASRGALTRSAEARARMKPWVVAAQARFRVACELRDSETQPVALGLLADAAFFALSALAVADSALDALGSSRAAAWQHFEARSDKPAGAPEQLALVSAAFSRADPLSLERLAPREANELRLAAEASVAWLLTLVEIRPPRELARARLVRTALAVVGLALLGWGLVAYWLSLAALEPPR